MSIVKKGNQYLLIEKIFGVSVALAGGTYKECKETMDALKSNEGSAPFVRNW